MKLKLFIEPNDVLYFRDGKPFDSGGDHVARLVFPPNPITFYGAIRAAVIGHSVQGFKDFVNSSIPDSVKKVAGTPDSFGSLTITHFGMGKVDANSNIEHLYPMPADLAKVKETNEYVYVSPERQNDRLKVNFPSQQLRTLAPDRCKDEFLEDIKGFLQEHGMKKYLNSEPLNETDVLSIEDVFQREHRVGITRNTHTHTSKKRRLYTIEFARLNEKEGIGFCIELEGINGVEEKFSKHTLLRLGGESRSARYRIITTWNTTRLDVKPNSNYKLTFLTPAIFKQGWLPDGFDEQTLTGIILGNKATLVSAAVGRPVGIGGWDIVNNKAKPMRRAVPAGSVYFFEGTPPPADLNGCIHLGSDDDARQGLGQAIISSWNKQE